MIADLEKQIEQLERKSREKQLIFYGVPRQENEECLTPSLAALHLDLVRFIEQRTEIIKCLVRDVKNLAGTVNDFKELDEIPNCPNAQENLPNHKASGQCIPAVSSALENKLQGLKVRELRQFLPRICFFNVEAENADEDIVKAFLFTDALSQLPGDKSVRVAHRFPTRNGTCTAFIELDLASYKAIGRRGGIIVDHVILNYEESVRVCYCCCGYRHNADRCTKATVTCFHCASGDHLGRSCPTLANPRTAKCANCSGNGLSADHEPRSMSCPTARARAAKFKAGRISIEDDPRQARPKFQRTDENVQKITDLIKENPRTTLLELEQDTGISKTTIGRIVTEDLKLKKTPAKFIPRFLTNEQKLCRLATCEDMLEMTRTDPEWKDKIITGDETWVYGYDPETKPQSAEWRG
ncbi:hypothetical protein LAZ67_4002504 [Cordylochernes scorpioides]|uniref:CCHC-type domain-containing protein n=1 Tax=Cordylochernes scorpioides TaxID=51811 RepID=A0ABY6KCU7_9ARAC|nr:hypothetical protein LAZ67_4002504 [Cordylochernes scorpioides]